MRTKAASEKCRRGSEGFRQGGENDRKKSREISTNKWSRKVRFTQQEDEELVELIRLHGKKWGVIAGKMKNTNQTRVRNRYYSYIRKNPNSELARFHTQNQNRITSGTNSFYTSSSQQLDEEEEREGSCSQVFSNYEVAECIQRGTFHCQDDSVVLPSVTTKPSESVIDQHQYDYQQQLQDYPLQLVRECQKEDNIGNQKMYKEFGHFNPNQILNYHEQQQYVSLAQLPDDISEMISPQIFIKKQGQEQFGSPCAEFGSEKIDYFKRDFNAISQVIASFNSCFALKLNEDNEDDINLNDSSLKWLIPEKESLDLKKKNKVNINTIPQEKEKYSKNEKIAFLSKQIELISQMLAACKQQIINELLAKINTNQQNINTDPPNEQ